MLRFRSVGPIYVGLESHTAEPKHLSRAWFRELAAPWRIGNGLRVRIGTRAVQVGFCRRVVGTDTSALSQLGGRSLEWDPHEIGQKQYAMEEAHRDGDAEPSR